MEGRAPENTQEPSMSEPTLWNVSSEAAESWEIADMEGEQKAENEHSQQSAVNDAISMPPARSSSVAAQSSGTAQNDELQHEDANTRIDMNGNNRASKVIPSGPARKRPSVERFIVNLDSDEPEGICTQQTPTREVFARPGSATATTVDFRGWIIADIDPNKAGQFAKDHLCASRRNKEHVVASVTSTNAKDGQAVGVVCFGDLDQNLERGLVTKVIFPFKVGDDVMIRELAAIRHAFTEGFASIEDREEGAGGINAAKIKVKTFSVVTTSIAAVRKIWGYKSMRMARQFKLCYKLDALLRDICEVSADLAENDVKTCLYYAPDNGTAPLTLAAINASFVGEIQGLG